VQVFTDSLNIPQYEIDYNLVESIDTGSDTQYFIGGTSGLRSFGVEAEAIPKFFYRDAGGTFYRWDGVEGTTVDFDPFSTLGHYEIKANGTTISLHIDGSDMGSITPVGTTVTLKTFGNGYSPNAGFGNSASCTVAGFRVFDEFDPSKGKVPLVDYPMNEGVGLPLDISSNGNDAVQNTGEWVDIASSPQSWRLMEERTSAEYFSDINCYRNDTNEVYVSQGLPQTSDSFEIKVELR
jgi:hypothetical protein